MAHDFKVTEWQDLGKSGMVEFTSKRFREQLTIESDSAGEVSIHFWDPKEGGLGTFPLSQEEVKALIEFLQKRL